MSNIDLANYTFGFLQDTIYLAGIPLLIATVIGLLIAILQAITQIQDQTLSQTVKIVVIVSVFMIAGKVLIKPILLRTETLFTEIHRF